MSNTHPFNSEETGNDSLFINSTSTIGISGIRIMFKRPIRFGLFSSVPNRYLKLQSRNGLITLPLYGRESLPQCRHTVVAFIVICVKAFAANL